MALFEKDCENWQELSDFVIASLNNDKFTTTVGDIGSYDGVGYQLFDIDMTDDSNTVLIKGELDLGRLFSNLIINETEEASFRTLFNADLVDIDENGSLVRVFMFNDSFLISIKNRAGVYFRIMAGKPSSNLTGTWFEDNRTVENVFFRLVFVANDLGFFDEAPITPLYYSPYAAGRGSKVYSWQSFYGINNYSGRPYAVDTEIFYTGGLSVYNEEATQHATTLSEFKMINPNSQILPESTVELDGNDYMVIPVQWADLAYPENYSLALLVLI